MRPPTSRSLRLLLLAGGLLCGCGEQASSSRGYALPQIYERELIVEGAFESRDAFHLGALTPNLEPTPELGPESDEMPALVLTPPASVEVEVRADDGRVDLIGFAGVDRSAYALLPAGAEPWRLVFEVRVDGAPAWSTEIAVRSRRGARRNTWQPFAVEDLRPGQRVSLHTRLADGSEAPSGLRAGFGRLVFERRAPVARQRPSPERPNAILIVIDTLRADRLGCYGHERDSTPNLDALAARGVLYEECAATSSWTWPSTASILTGLSPVEHGVQSYASGYLRGSLRTLGEAALAEGLATAAFSGNPLIGPHKNYQQGFETFDFDLWLRDSDVLVPAAMEWIAEHRDERFFLYLHLVDPHAPYAPEREQYVRLFGPEAWPEGSPPPFVSPGPMASIRPESNPLSSHEGPWDAEDFADMGRAYDACVATLDARLGALFAQLEQLGLAESTALVVTSDHGEELGDRGLFGHGQSIHRELVRVPLIAAGPGVPANVRRRLPFSNRRVAEGLARWCGWDLGLAGATDLRTGGGEAEDVHFFTTRGWWDRRDGRRIAGLRRGDWVLHWTPDAGADLGPQQRLYDLRSDPEERSDLSGTEAQRLRAMQTDLERRWLGVEEAGTGLPDGAALDRLRDIGYVGDDD